VLLLKCFRSGRTIRVRGTTKVINDKADALKRDLGWQPVDTKTNTDFDTKCDYRIIVKAGAHRFQSADYDGKEMIFYPSLVNPKFMWVLWPTQGVRFEIKRESKGTMKASTDNDDTLVQPEMRCAPT